MKAGWAEASIGDVCELMTGGTPSKSVPENFDGDVPWLVSGDIHRGEIVACDGRISEQGLNNSNARWLPLNSVMIALNGQGKTRGTVAMLRMAATCNQSLVSIMPREGSNLLPEFLFHNLRARYDELRKMTGDGGNERRGLNMRLLRTIVLPLPPLEEQQRIVAILDEAFEGLDRAKVNAEANLASARELFEGALSELFDKQSAPKVPLSSLTTDRGITYGVIKLGEHQDGGVPCLRTSNVRHLNIDTEGMKRISPTLSEEYGRTILEGGEVLVNVRGTLGGVASVPPEMIGWNISREVAMVAVDAEKVDPDFISTFIATNAAQKWLTGVVKGAAYKGINLADLRNLPVPVPSSFEQASLSSKARALRANSSRLEGALQKKLGKLDQLRQSLLAKALAGELT